MLTASSCATLAAVRCRITPITLFTVGSCDLERNLDIDGNRTSSSMPPDFALVLGGMTVFKPVCGHPARWKTRSSSRRTSPHGTARTTTFQRPPRLNCQHSSRSDEFDTRNFSSRGSPGQRRWAANLQSDPGVPPVWQEVYIIVTMNQRRETDTPCLCRVIGCICPPMAPHLTGADNVISPYPQYSAAAAARPIIEATDTWRPGGRSPLRHRPAGRR